MSLSMVSDMLVSPFYIGLLGFLTILIFCALGVITGNPVVLGVFSKLGFLVYSGKPKRDARFVKSMNPDMIGFLKVPNTVYSPIFPSTEGKYKHHDFLGRKNPSGELVLDTSELAKALKPLSCDRGTADSIFTDLSIIKGTVNNKSRSVSTSKFTSLIKYVNTDLKRHHPTISLYEDGEVRNFSLVFAVEIGLEDKKPLQFNTREAFLISLRKLSFYDSREVITSNVLILNGYTGIDSVLLVLQEKEG